MYMTVRMNGLNFTINKKRNPSHYMDDVQENSNVYSLVFRTLTMLSRNEDGIVFLVVTRFKTTHNK